ncbi:MAG: hypothetical protein IH965_13660 [Gemmatimonadetes bacterium]|nr:hypothetical protein [Gemmatimonadota bacterium]
MTGFAERTEQPPYFLAYEVWDQWQQWMGASNGAIVTDQRRRQRLLDADVRIGDHQFDNTHRFQGRAFFRGSFFRQAEPLPLGDDEDALRAVIWLRTENEYRQALERLIQVEANRAATAAPEDTSYDFSRESPYVVIEDVPTHQELDRSTWPDRVRRLSARFDGHPTIYNSTVFVSTSREVRYIVNSEGTRVRTGDTRAGVSVQATTRADDGMDLSLQRRFTAFTLAGLPSEDALAAAIDTLIYELEALRTAPVVEPFTGPAILSGRASAVFFHEIFGHRIEGHRQKDEAFAQTFTKKVGEEVLPSYLDVFDDPTRTEYEGTQLAGHYRVDDEGVPARRVSVVEDGALTGFLMGRSPIQAEPQSNGHGRRQPGYDVVARQGNLIVESQRTVPAADLRGQLREEILRQGKPYGLYFQDIRGGFTFTGRTLPQSFKVIPVKVYRIYADGRPDELVRGVDIVGTPLTIFGKILATDDRPEVFNGMCRAESGFVPVSAVSPALLISEIEIEKTGKSMERTPVLTPPPSEGELERVAAGDVLLEAMNDELARSMEGLHLEGLADPYYMAYRVHDGMTLTIEAAFGSIVTRHLSRSRMLEADVRVGSPEADNSNYFDPGSRLGLPFVSLPIDDRYAAIRHQIWRVSDERYKQAAKALAGKTAELEGNVEDVEVPDFSQESPYVAVEDPVQLSVDEAAWVELAEGASAVFRGYPTIEDARARVLVRLQNRYFTSSEGSRSRVPQTVYAVLLTATARGASGRPVRDYRLFVARTPNGLPGSDHILSVARDLAAELTAEAEVEPIDSYVGPVLFDGRAAAQFFYSLLGQNLSGTPNPVVPARFARSAPAEKRFERLIGRRIMPRGFTVVDDPTRSAHDGASLVGHYTVDDEGMAPQRVVAVEGGTLNAFLMSRTPSEGSQHTTGHGRSGSLGAEPRATISNLIIEADDVLDESELQAEFLSLVDDVGLEYGIVVRGLADPAFVQSGQDRLSMFRMGGPQQESVLPPPVAAYKLFPNGHEEPIQGMEFVDVTVRALRDIVAAGDAMRVYNFVFAGDQPFARPCFSFGPGGPGAFRWCQLPASIVAPPVLVEEIELRQTEPEGKPPVLTHPYFDRRR